MKRRLIPAIAPLIMMHAPPVAQAVPAAHSTDASQCSANALPAHERQQMSTEYRKRMLTQGKAKADAWAAEQGRRFHQQLVDRGICPPSSRTAQTRKPDVRGKDGKPCKRTRLENRNVANLSGGPMQMVLVPVCDD